MRNWLKKWRRRMVLGFFVLFVVLPLVWFTVFRFVPVPFTSFMLQASIAGWMRDPPQVLRHDWVPLAEISPHLQRAVIAAEDQKFAGHAGLDLAAIEAALEHNRTSVRVRGGSTISQQTVKNIFLWRNRSYLRKALEAWLALLMEIVWTKERILEVYLNSVEFGPGIYGAQAAAQYSFGKPAARLTRREAALLATVLPAPASRRAARPTSYMLERARWIEAQMVRIGPVEQVISQPQAQQ